MNHRAYMEQAIELSLKGSGYVSPNPLVGCLIVKEGKIIGQGYHKKCGDLHAERMALANVCEDPKGASCYVSLEPCCHQGKQPPCTKDLIQAGIKKVYVSLLDPNPKVRGKGVEELKRAGIEVEVGLLESLARKTNEIFLTSMEEQSPFIALKYAMTLDGKIASKTGDSKWITCEKSRNYVHKLRHRYRAIMVGIGTVLADDPLLTARIPNANHPTRIICDPHLKTPIQSKIVKSAKEVPSILVCLDKQREKIEAYQRYGLEILFGKEKKGKIDLKDLMKTLYQKEIDSVLVEGGASLLGNFFDEKLGHRLHAFISPKMIGGKGAISPFCGLGMEKMEEAATLSSLTYHFFDDDICMEGRMEYVHRNH